VLELVGQYDGSHARDFGPVIGFSHEFPLQAMTLTRSVASNDPNGHAARIAPESIEPSADTIQRRSPSSDGDW
jgi:hypothetical protein